MPLALITGATGNLGQAVVKKFLSENFTVIGTTIPNDPVKLTINNNRFHSVEADLSNSKDSEKLVSGIISNHGNIHSAVLTVGGFVMGSISETSVEDIRKQIELNFETAYNIARPVFLHMMKEKFGRIFLIGSRPALSAADSKATVAYGLSKLLVVRLAELLNAEAGKVNVVATVIAPSTIDTPQNRKSMPEADRSKWARPEDIADLIFYHSSEKNIIRGNILKVGI